MKICIAFHACMDLGGIINHTEQLIGGLVDLGHSVTLFEMVYADNAGSQNKIGDFERGPSGIPFDQGKGWNFPNRNRIAYKTFAGVNSAKQILNEFDIVIWTVPVVPKNQQHLGNDKWPELYALEPRVKQIAFIHDGNCPQGYPHIYHIAEHLTGLACVHSAAMNGASKVPVPRAMILNPQYQPIREITAWYDKHEGFVSMQTFKAWKRVHELIEAISYMPPLQRGELREIAGKGIEYQYMTSENKCKEAYYHDNPEKPFHTRRIWDSAIENGMIHHEYWNTNEVEEWLSMARVLVDPSWSKKYGKLGGHWNRVIVDAMIHCVIPVAHKKHMGEELFQAGKHYVDLDPARDAQDYADIILEAGSDNLIHAQHYRDYAREVLPMFDRKSVAQRLIDLAYGNIETVVGEIDPKTHEKYEEIMFRHFGVLV